MSRRNPPRNLHPNTNENLPEINPSDTDPSSEASREPELVEDDEVAPIEVSSGEEDSDDSDVSQEEFERNLLRGRLDLPSFFFRNVVGGGGDDSDSSDSEDFHGRGDHVDGWEIYPGQPLQDVVSRDIPIDLSKAFTNDSFEKLIRLYCRPDQRPDTWQSANSLLPRCRDVIKDKFHLKGRVADVTVNIHFHKDEETKIANIECSSCLKDNLLWCMHACTLLLLYSRYPHLVMDLDEKKKELSKIPSHVLSMAYINLSKKNPEFLNFMNVEMNKMKKNTEIENQRLFDGVVDDEVLCDFSDLPLMTRRTTENFFEAGVFSSKLEDVLRIWKRIRALGRNYDQCTCGGFSDYDCNSCEITRMFKEVQTLLGKYSAIANTLIDRQNLYSGIEILLELFRTLVTNALDVGYGTVMLPMIETLKNSFQEAFINHEYSDEFQSEFKSEIGQFIEAGQNQQNTGLVSILQSVETTICGNWNSTELLKVLRGESTTISEPPNVVAARIKKLQLEGKKIECLNYSLATQSWSVYYSILIGLGRYKDALEKAKTLPISQEGLTVFAQVINDILCLGDMPNLDHIKSVFEFALPRIDQFARFFPLNPEVIQYIVFELLESSLKINAVEKIEPLLIKYGTDQIEQYVQFLIGHEAKEVAFRIIVQLSMDNSTFLAREYNIRAFWDCSTNHKKEFLNIMKDIVLDVSTLTNLCKDIPELEGKLFETCLSNWKSESMGPILAKMDPTRCTEEKLDAICAIPLPEGECAAEGMMVSNLALLFEHFFAYDRNGKAFHHILLLLTGMYPIYGFFVQKYDCRCHACAPIRDFLSNPRVAVFESVGYWEHPEHQYRHLLELGKKPNIVVEIVPLKKKSTKNKKVESILKIKKIATEADHVIFQTAVDVYARLCSIFVPRFPKIDLSCNPNPFVQYFYLKNLFVIENPLASIVALKASTEIKKAHINVLKNPLMTLFQKEYDDLNKMANELITDISMMAPTTENKANIVSQIQNRQITDVVMLKKLVLRFPELNLVIFKMQIDEFNETPLDHDIFSLSPGQVNYDELTKIVSEMKVDFSSPHGLANSFDLITLLVLHLQDDRVRKFVFMFLDSIAGYGVKDASTLKSNVDSPDEFLCEMIELLKISCPDSFRTGDFPFTFYPDLPLCAMQHFEFYVKTDPKRASNVYLLLTARGKVPKYDSKFYQLFDELVQKLGETMDQLSVITFLEQAKAPPQTILSIKSNTIEVDAIQFRYFVKLSQDLSLSESTTLKCNIRPELMDYYQKVLAELEYDVTYPFGVCRPQILVTLFEEFAKLKDFDPIIIQLFKILTSRPIPFMSEYFDYSKVKHCSCCPEIQKFLNDPNTIQFEYVTISCPERGSKKTLPNLKTKNFVLNREKRTSLEKIVDPARQIAAIDSFSKLIYPCISWIMEKQPDFIDSIKEHPNFALNVALLQYLNKANVHSPLLKPILTNALRILATIPFSGDKPHEKLVNYFQMKFVELTKDIIERQFTEDYQNFEKTLTYTSYRDILLMYGSYPQWNTKWKHLIINSVFKLYAKMTNEAISLEIMARNLNPVVMRDHIRIFLESHTKETPIGGIAVGIINSMKNNDLLLSDLVETASALRIQLFEINFNQNVIQKRLSSINDLDFLKMFFTKVHSLDPKLCCELMLVKLEEFKNLPTPKEYKRDLANNFVLFGNTLFGDIKGKPIMFKNILTNWTLAGDRSKGFFSPPTKNIKK